MSRAVCERVQIGSMFGGLLRFLERVFTVVYEPKPVLRAFLARAQTQETPLAQVTAAVLSAEESHELFGVPLAHRGIQPVFFRIENRHTTPLRLYVLDVDPHYYTPLEAAGINHFSVLKRLSAYGLAAWYFLPLLLLMPAKLYTAARANRRMDDCFREQGFPLRPIQPGATAEGFIYTTLDVGTKTVHVCLYATGGAGSEVGPVQLSELDAAPKCPAVDLNFLIPVPGVSLDYLQHDFSSICPASHL